jgi:alkanesulfonate monooxygenase SsuD/methylene tetrahydromethanopterin reductase-like flavin-dependent oxidoreductase (luciferase family)
LQRLPGDSRSHRDIYSDFLYLVQLIEDVGLESIWLTEHHFAEDGYVAAQLPVTAAAAGLTRRVLLSPGLLAPLYHPLRLAEDLAALDLLSGGRVIAGMGTGYRRAEFEGLGVPFDEADVRLDETLDILELAATGKPFNYEGRIFRFHGARVTPSHPRPGGPSLMIMGSSESSADRAARRRAMLMCDPAQTWEEIARIVARYDNQMGNPSIDLPIFCYGFIAEHDPWTLMRDGFLHVRETYDAWMGRPLPASRDAASYRLLIGGRVEAAEKMLAVRQQFGDRVHLVIRLDYPGMDRSSVSEAIRLYGDAARLVRSAGAE